MCGDNFKKDIIGSKLRKNNKKNYQNLLTRGDHKSVHNLTKHLLGLFVFLNL